MEVGTPLQYTMLLLFSHYWTGYPWGLAVYKLEVLMGEGEGDVSSLFPVQQSREGVGWGTDQVAQVQGWMRYER